MQSISIADDFLQIKEEDYELALEKCGVTDIIALDSIASIKEWYRKQLHFPEDIFRDGQIFRILLMNNFSLERTKQKIDNMLTARSLLPEIMLNRDPRSEHIQTVFQYSMSGIIPKRLDDMTRINIVGFKCDDNLKFVFEDYLKMVISGNEYMMFTDVCLGYHCIADWKGLKISHLAQTSPALIKKFLFVITKCYGTKIKSIHNIHLPVGAEWVLAVVKACLSNKILGRLHVHKNPEDLHKFFPKALLPSDLGGENKTMEELSQDFKKNILQNCEDILKTDRLKSDESKRVGVCSAISKELQGMQGSFRSLDID